MKKNVLILLVTVCAMSFSLHAGQKPNKTRVGIIDFTTKGGVAASDAETIGEIFRSKLVTRDVFDVLERNSMNSILKEQELQNTGCTESSCAVQIGKILNMEYMIYGQIMQAAGSFYLTIKMIHIESSKAIISIDEKYSGVDNVIEDMSSIIKKLTENSKVRKRAENITDGNGMLKISCTPPGAQVVVNGRKAGQVPILIEAKAGVYDISISSDGYMSKKFKFTVEEGLINEISETLTAGLGLEEAERKRNDYFWGFVRNSSITALCAGAAVGSVLVGNFYNDQGGTVYKQYVTSYASSDSTQLGDLFQQHFDTADTFFFAAESLTVAGAVFVVFSVIDYLQWNYYTEAANKISPFTFNVKPIPYGGTAVSVSMKF
ncbi:MAG: PEGA domain-containing protein [Spirochaetes bacterium]|nr:PEGA domain-containing protein [Spirochaetota bacterium]